MDTRSLGSITMDRPRKFASKVLPLATVPTQDALAVAFAAYRINNGYNKETRRYSEPENKTLHANKDLVKWHFKQEWSPEDFKPFSPTEDDYVAVYEAQKWLKRYVLLGLGDLDDFKKQMIASVAEDTVPINNLGRVAYIPEFVRRDKQENDLKKEIRIEYRTSEYLGKEKDLVEGVIKILDKRYSSQWESYNYTASLDGNLVSFMNKFDYAVGSMKRIKAKVKAQTKNKLFEAKETRLNYVRLYKV